MQYTQVDLKEYCQILHTEAEQTQLSQDLVSGDIDPFIYKTMLWQLFLVTDVIESRYSFADNTIHRKYKILEDIALLQPSRLITCKSTELYINHLRTLDYHLLKGHIYCLYLGWLYGGQMIAKRLIHPANHLIFDNVKEKINYIRGHVLSYITRSDLSEAEIAFRYAIDMYKEVYELHRTS